MKKRIYCFLFVAIIPTLGLLAQDQPSQKDYLHSVSLTISGMACQEGCADAIQANLKKNTGVHSADVSYILGKAEIDFDPKEVSLDSLKSIVTETKVKAYSYTVDKVVQTNSN